MANQWFGFGGDDTTGAGTLANPWLTYEKAKLSSNSGDTCFMVAGKVAAHATPGYMNLDAKRNVISTAFRQAVQTPDAAQTTYCGRFSGSLSAASNPHIIEGVVFDGENRVTQSFEFGQDAAEDLILQMHNCHVFGGTSHDILINHRRGRVELANVKVSGTPAVSGIISTSSLAGDGNQVIDIQGIDLDLTVASGTVNGVNLTKANNLTNTLSLNVKGITGKISASGTASAMGVQVRSVDPTVSNFNFTIEGDGIGNIGVLARGQSVAICTNPVIGNGKLKFKCKAGYGISLGQSTLDSFVTGGEISGCEIEGRYYATDSPHGFLLGQGTSGTTTRGNVAKEIFVGFLASKCVSGVVEACYAFDTYGPAYYIKGTTAFTVQDNFAFISGKLTQRNRGILAVAPQGATNTAGATFSRNLICVADVSKIHSLSYIEDASQVCAYSNNTYIIPDTIDVNTANLFSYKNGAGGVANNTLAQWNAQSEVTNDVIIQLPLSEIFSMINRYKSSVTGSSGVILI